MTIEAHFRENAMNLHIPDVRILEVHPAPSHSLRGNCHSSPALQERNGLGLTPLLRGVADAAKLGYNFLNVAGVEPLRYRSEEHTSELQSLRHLVCRLLLEKK